VESEAKKSEAKNQAITSQPGYLFFIVQKPGCRESGQAIVHLSI
jgi:hypothetical protein